MGLFAQVGIVGSFPTLSDGEEGSGWVVTKVGVVTCESADDDGGGNGEERSD